MDNKILFCFLLSLNLIRTANLDAMQDLSESTIQPEFRTVTAQAMLHYRAIKKIHQVWNNLLRGALRGHDIPSGTDPDFEVLCKAFRAFGMNPNFGRTKKGLAFTFIGDHCTRLHTPWGIIEFQSDFAVLKKRLDQFSETETVENEMCGGKGYCIVKTIDGKPLPAPNAKQEPNWPDENGERFPFHTEGKFGDYSVIGKVLCDMETEYHRTTHQ